MKPLDPRPWDSLPVGEREELTRIYLAVKEWNSHKTPVNLDKVKTKKGRA